MAGAANALRPTIQYAAARNVIVNLENDDPELASATRIVAILKTVASPYLRALPDFANSLMGGDEVFNADAVRNMFAYATNIAHVKDAELIAKTRRTVSLLQLLTTARQANFKGFYSMESDSNVDPVQDTKHLIEQCLRLI
jgi:L-ribulose-5-phosphate 3-epimerase UlaE